MERIFIFYFEEIKELQKVAKIGHKEPMFSPLTFPQWLHLM